MAASGGSVWPSSNNVDHGWPPDGQGPGIRNAGSLIGWRLQTGKLPRCGEKEGDLQRPVWTVNLREAWFAMARECLASPHTRG